MSRFPTARILAVEEEKSLLQLYRSILNPEGFEVVGAAGQAQAMEFLRRGRARFVLLIVDVEMFDGEGFMDRIREGHPEIPILNCSRNLDQGLQLVKAGVCAGSIPKPFEIGLFTKTVRLNSRMELERRSGRYRRMGQGSPPRVERRADQRRKPLSTAISL